MILCPKQLAPKDSISEHYRLLVEESLIQMTASPHSFSLHQEEEDEIWKDVSIEMDLGEVWEGVSIELDHFMPLNRHTGIILRSAAALLVILIGIIPVQKAIVNPEIILPYIVQNEQAEKEYADFRKDIPADPAKRAGDLRPDPTQQGNESVNIEARMDSVQEALPGKNPISMPPETAERPRSEPADIHDAEDQTGPAALAEIQLEPTTVPTEMHYDRLEFDHHSSTAGSPPVVRAGGKFSVGLAAIYRNTWLLNQNTFNGLKSTKLIATEVVFSPDFGVCLNYALNKHWTLQNEGFFYSNTGQAYRDYVNGNYTRIDYALKYSTIYLSVKYKFFRKENALIRTSINLMGGAYVSLLQKADKRTNNALKNVSADYNPLDYGIRLVGEFEFYFSDHFSSAPGISLSCGIPNIYRGDFMRTNNASAGFQVICYYRF